MSGLMRGLVATAARTLKVGKSELPTLDTSGNLKVTLAGSAGGAAAAAADATANPTLGGMLSYVLGYNGATWDRVRVAVVAKTATFTGLLNTLPLGRFNNSPPTLTDGDAQLLQLTSAGNLRAEEQKAPVAEDNANGVFAVLPKPVVGGTYSPTRSHGLGALPGNIKASAGNLLGLYAVNRNAAVRYLQLFNSTGAPSGTPLCQFLLVATTGTVLLDQGFFGQGGWDFATGITVGISSTAGSYTAATAADHDFSVVYK